MIDFNDWFNGTYVAGLYHLRYITKLRLFINQQHMWK